MRKPCTTLAMTLGLCLGLTGLVAQAGERAADVRSAPRTVDSAAVLRALAVRQQAGGHSGWLQMIYVVQVVTLPPIGHGTNGIIDEPDPTSARDRARNPGIGGSGGGAKQRRESQSGGGTTGDSNGPSQAGFKFK
jgi:hypothetical protein